jgi:hypothetical protein
MLKIVRQPAFYSLGFLVVFSVAAFIFIYSVLIPNPYREIQAQTQMPQPSDCQPATFAADVHAKESEPPPGNAASQGGQVDYAISATLRDILVASQESRNVFDPPPLSSLEGISLSESIPLTRPASITNATPEPAAFLLAGPAIIGLACALVRRARR